MSDNAIAELQVAARVVALRARAPFSGFRVGAAVLDERGRTHLGCNVESCTYTLTSHAEANAIAASVAAGAERIVAVAVVCLDAAGPHEEVPCGLCRQLIVEAGGSECVVVTGEAVTTAGELLPGAFTLPSARPGGSGA